VAKHNNSLAKKLSPYGKTGSNYDLTVNSAKGRPPIAIPSELVCLSRGTIDSCSFETVTGLCEYFEYKTRAKKLSNKYSVGYEFLCKCTSNHVMYSQNE
jgi:hypothetical protein